MKETIENMYELFNKGWALVTAGGIDDFNTMTVSWGSLGTLWNRSIVTVYIKPCRYTHEFMEKYDRFTVSFFDPRYRKDLSLLGSKSGREGDKLALTGLDPVAVGSCVSFSQAKATIVCHKIYQADFDPAGIPADVMDRYYTSEAPHTMYIGEVEMILYGEQEQ